MQRTHCHPCGMRMRPRWPDPFSSVLLFYQMRSSSSYVRKTAILHYHSASGALWQFQPSVLKNVLWWPCRALATRNQKPRQGRKAATVLMDVGAEVFRQGRHPLDQRVFNRYQISRCKHMLAAHVLSFASHRRAQHPLRQTHSYVLTRSAKHSLTV